MENFTDPSVPNTIIRILKTAMTVLFVGFVVLVVAALFYFKWTLNTSKDNDSTKNLFEVKKGETTLQISKNLRNKNFIKSDLVFFLNTEMKKKNLMPGMYELSSAMTMQEIFIQLSEGKTKLVKVTIPEGYRTEQIAELLSEKKLVSYNEFVNKAKKYEGQLFPDTYYFSPGKTTESLINTMVENFKKRTGGISITAENLIVASIVEREAIKDEERPLIAGIYENRLKKNMKLEADPTVQYAKDNLGELSLAENERSSFKYWSPITKDDYHSVESTYNTYEISGLPPGPICNPGLKSIEASINYEKQNYLYFLQADGNIYPAKTLQEHEQNIAKVFGR